jgi:hypothetical protein
MKVDVILIIGSIMLLSIFSLTLNRNLVNDNRVMYEGQAIMEALKLAQKYIELAELKRFDENSAATIPSSFTANQSLGKDGSESINTFDDVDDFKGYSTSDAVSYSVPFTVSIDVQYANVGSSVTVATTATYFKLFTVSIQSWAFTTLPSQTLVIKKLFAYHYFLQD